MTDELTKNFKAECKDSISENIELDITSFELDLDGIIVKHGSAKGLDMKGVKYPMHGFIMNTSENEVIWKIEKNETIMKKNDIWFLPANESADFKTEDFFEFITVLISPAKMISSSKTLLTADDISFRMMTNIQDSHLEQLLKLLLSEVRTENANGKLFIENLISIFAMHFVKNYTNSENDLVKNVNGFTEKDYEKILLHIENNLTENISIDELAEKFGIGKHDFFKKFKTSTNITPYKFIVQKKLERSKQLLREFKYTLTDITYLLNFTDQSHFTKSFKKMFGVTPNEFRKTTAT